jgi:hypothetical protein
MYTAITFSEHQEIKLDVELGEHPYLVVEGSVESTSGCATDKILIGLSVEQLQQVRDVKDKALSARLKAVS